MTSADNALPATAEQHPGDAIQDPCGTPDTVRILAPDGTFAPSPAADKYLPLIEELGDEQLEQFYRDMVVVRALDTQATMLQRQGQLALWPPSRGQEAAQVGSVRAARGQDHFFPSYREHAVATLRGVAPIGLARLFRAVTHGGWDPSDPKNGGTRLYTLVLGTQTLHATGFAMGLNFDGRSGTGDPDHDELVVAYYGDGATSEGDVHEAMVFAASYRTPQIFFLQNNHWAISVPSERQSRSSFAPRAAGYGIESIRIDGNDVLASYAVSRLAGDEARAGGGPRAIEAVTYRMGAHTTSDDPTKYRTTAEEHAWAERDPIERMAAYLRGRGASAEFFDGIKTEADDAAADLRDGTVKIADPSPETMFENVYSEPHSLIEEQRRWYLDYEASFEEGGQ